MHNRSRPWVQLSLRNTPRSPTDYSQNSPGLCPFPKTRALCIRGQVTQLFELARATLSGLACGRGARTLPAAARHEVPHGGRVLELIVADLSEHVVEGLQARSSFGWRVLTLARLYFG